MKGHGNWAPTPGAPPGRTNPKSSTLETLPGRSPIDSLHSRALALAQHDTSMRQALAHEALESGLNSPPQVGGGAIDVLTAFGVSIARRMEYSDEEAFVTWDRDLAAADPDPDEEIVIALDTRDADADPCDGVFFGRAGDNGPRLGL